MIMVLRLVEIPSDVDDVRNDSAKTRHEPSIGTASQRMDRHGRRVVFALQISTQYAHTCTRTPSYSLPVEPYCLGHAIFLYVS